MDYHGNIGGSGPSGPNPPNMNFMQYPFTPSNDMAGAAELRPPWEHEKHVSSSLRTNN